MRASAHKQREPSLDLLRAFAILYVVAFWHLTSYMPVLKACNNSLTRLLTSCVLGLFVFISGRLLASRYQITCLREVWCFYERRFFRTYPLYFVALTAFYLVGLIDLKPYLLAAVLLNMIFNEPVVTLWFAAMIMILYALTPLFLFRYSMLKTVLLVVGLSAVLVAVHERWGLVDISLLRYLPIFAAGVVAGRSALFRDVSEKRLIGGIGLVVFVLAWWWEPALRSPLSRLVLIQVATLGSLPVFFILTQVAARITTMRIVGVLSYASYALYLVHRVVFLLALKLFFPRNTVGVVSYLAGLVLPFTVLVAYGLQRGYDRLLKWGSA